MSPNEKIATLENANDKLTRQLSLASMTIDEMVLRLASLERSLARGSAARDELHEIVQTMRNDAKRLASVK